MKNRQNSFAISAGVLVSALGVALALSELSSWALALVGIAIAMLGVISMLPEPQSRLQLKPVKAIYQKQRF